jgi:NADH-quinone oxidoreductase subunit N
MADKQIRVEASIKYFILNGVASLFFCLACVFIFLKIGGLHFTEFFSIHESILIQYSILFITLSFLGKFGTMPFSIWLIDIYSVISLRLLGFLFIPLKLVVYFIFFKIYISVLAPYFWCWQPILLSIGILSLIYGCIGSLQQFLIKRFLAWTAINQAGYLLIGLSLGTMGSFIVIWNYFIIYIVTSLLIFLILSLIKRQLKAEVTYFSDLIILFENKP